MRRLVIVCFVISISAVSLSCQSQSGEPPGDSKSTTLSQPSPSAVADSEPRQPGPIECPCPLTADQDAGVPAAASVVYGSLYSLTTASPVPGTIVFLDRVDEESRSPLLAIAGADREQGDIVGVTDEAGQLGFCAVPVGQYYLVVWTVYGWLVAPDRAIPGEDLLVSVGEQACIDVGRIELHWP